ncbi:MAG: hypothetical protein K1X88_01140 [Nannocystaceae bacterium]|nr:hypothetical protein [Nannocystaceae bacterium]
MRTLALALTAAALLAGCASPSPNQAGSDEASTTAASTSTAADDTSTSGSSGSGSDGSSGSGSDSSTGDGPPPDPVTMMLMDAVIFYDGYAATVDEPVPEGIVRHSNALMATRFTEAQQALLQQTLMLGVIVGARCDNYDRIGAVHLALVPKGAEGYVPAEVDRIEVARFITPFMDMNESPMTVPYEFEVDDLLPILRDPALLAEYDLWFELMIFGVPYAANTEIPGCADRNDTQDGTLLLYTDSSREPVAFDALVPLAIEQSFNNYARGASDAIGTTRKTIAFEVPEGSQRSQLVLITSNHGANAGGEEYIRRDHLVSVDGAMVLQYKPGRTSCEPFRKYNTQGNGIYGPTPMTDEQWQSFSNWCPGDVIDIRRIDLGDIAPGPHEFVIDVPDAEFVGGQGDFPLSLYLQSSTRG